MITLLLAFILLSLVIAGMAIGVIMGKAPLKGSCGGVGAALGEKDYVCDLCGGDPQKCDEQQEQTRSTTATNKALAYDASQSTNK